MNSNRLTTLLILLALPPMTAFAQATAEPGKVRPRIVATTESQVTLTSDTATMKGSIPATVPSDLVNVITNPARMTAITPPPSLSYTQVRSRIDEAKREMGGLRC